MAVLTATDLKARVNDTKEALGNAQFYDLVDTLYGVGTMRLCRTLVSLTAVAQTNLFTVPTGYKLYVDEVIIEGQTAQSGGTSSTLKVGTTANSYGELLNGTSGHGFVAATGTTLLAVGRRVKNSDLYPPANMSVAYNRSFAAGDIVKADVSGTVLTAGAVYVELIGRLIPTES